MATIDPVKVKQFLTDCKIDLSKISKKSDIKTEITTKVSADTTGGLQTKLDALGTLDEVSTEAGNIFKAEIVDDTINKKIKPALNKSHDYDLTKGEITIPLNGVTGVKITGAGVTIVKEDADKLTVKVDPSTYKDGDNIRIEGKFKGEDVTLDTVQFKAKEISVPGTLKDGKATLSFPVELTDDQVTKLGSGTTFKVERDASDKKKVTVSLKDGQKITADTALPEIELDISGRKVKPKAFITKPTDAAADEESGGIAGWAKSNWKLLTGIVAGLVGLFASTKSEEGGGYLGIALGAVAGLLVSWNYGLGGASAEEAKPAPAKP